MKDHNKKTNKRGVSGVDIAVAIVVISMGLSIIVSMFIIINKTTNKVNREIEAVQLSKTIIERIKLMPYADFLELIREASNEHYEDYLGIDIPEGFVLSIETYRKTPTDLTEAILFNVSKEGVVKVKYMISKKMVEVKIPYIKYFDKVSARNAPNLNSESIDSPNLYESTTSFEPLDDITLKPVSSDELENWHNYGVKEAFLNKKYARRKNVNGVYDLFYWEPRYILVGGNKEYLLGKTMYSTVIYIKEIEFPNGVFLTLNIPGVEEKHGIPSSGEEEGTWVYTN